MEDETWRAWLKWIVAENRRSRGCFDVPSSVCDSIETALSRIAELEAENERLTAAVQRVEK